MNNKYLFHKTIGIFFKTVIIIIVGALAYFELYFIHIKTVSKLSYIVCSAFNIYWQVENWIGFICENVEYN